MPSDNELHRLLLTLCVKILVVISKLRYVERIRIYFVDYTMLIIYTSRPIA